MPLYSPSGSSPGITVLQNGATIGTRHGLNVVDGLITYTVTDDPGNDRVTVTPLAFTGATTIVTNSQSGTTYTLALTDADKVVEFTSASAVTLTVPANATVAFPVGSAIEVFRYGVGEVSVAAAAGVTIRSPGLALRINSQYSAAVLRKRATDEWVFEGDIKV